MVLTYDIFVRCLVGGRLVVVSLTLFNIPQFICTFKRFWRPFWGNVRRLAGSHRAETPHLRWDERGLRLRQKLAGCRKSL
jgi:hypothetical protein